ncbi:MULTISPECIES: hypothetical protein [Amycolatopsis]|uniref:hypothetical protein n=1 Tax=Amycolatopsis TaxID=1813 RepID=UPI00174BFA39|nr:hypothetical protein [Amycolatopsis bullii]
MSTGERDWRVLLDDLVLAVQRMTTPAQQPLVHYWDTHPDASSLLAARPWATTLSRLCALLDEPARE